MNSNAVKKKQLIIFSADIFRTKPLFYSIENDEIGISTFRTPLQKLGFSNVKAVTPNTYNIINLSDNSFKTFKIKEFNLKQYKTSYDDWIQAFDNAIKKRAYQSGNKKMFIGLSSGYATVYMLAKMNK